MNKLFIYIPTFNRPEALKEQLKQLIPQVNANAERVRLLVNDNNSNAYAIEDIAKTYAGIECVVFQKNGGNIGGNANIALGFVFAKPEEFVWILSDNDIVSPNAVDYILSTLQSDVDFYCFIDEIERPKAVLHHWRNGWQQPMDWRMGLISDALYNMNTVQNSIDDAFYFHNSSFPHLAVACSAAKKKGIMNFTLLPRAKITSAMHRSDECPTDYSLAQVCMPFLAALFPRNEARRFVSDWLKQQWWGMHQNRRVRYDLYLQSKSVVAHYGGWPVRVALHISFAMYFVLYPLFMLNKKAIEIAKRKLSPKTLAKLKHFRF
jgi:glycosyltransferase involved in cell wall biosynthesis